jgi:hypothetical protein
MRQIVRKQDLIVLWHRIIDPVSIEVKIRTKVKQQIVRAWLRWIARARRWWIPENWRIARVRRWWIPGNWRIARVRRRWRRADGGWWIWPAGLSGSGVGLWELLGKVDLEELESSPGKEWITREWHGASERELCGDGRATALRKGGRVTGIVGMQTGLNEVLAVHREFVVGHIHHVLRVDVKVLDVQVGPSLAFIHLGHFAESGTAGWAGQILAFRTEQT